MKKYYIKHESGDLYWNNDDKIWSDWKTEYYTKKECEDIIDSLIENSVCLRQRADFSGMTQRTFDPKQDSEYAKDLHKVSVAEFNTRCNIFQTEH